MLTRDMMGLAIADVLRVDGGVRHTVFDSLPCLTRCHGRALAKSLDLGLDGKLDQSTQDEYRACVVTFEGFFVGVGRRCSIADVLGQSLRLDPNDDGILMIVKLLLIFKKGREPSIRSPRLDVLLVFDSFGRGGIERRLS